MTKDYAAPITNVHVIYGVLIAAMHDNYIGCQLLQHTYLTGYLMLRHRPPSPTHVLQNIIEIMQA